VARAAPVAAVRIRRSLFTKFKDFVVGGEEA
jgi:hypothetical protein